jgi:hypothetical protein
LHNRYIIRCHPIDRPRGTYAAFAKQLAAFDLNQIALYGIDYVDCDQPGWQSVV